MHTISKCNRIVKLIAHVLITFCQIRQFCLCLFEFVGARFEDTRALPSVAKARILNKHLKLFLSFFRFR